MKKYEKYDNSYIFFSFYYFYKFLSLYINIYLIIYIHRHIYILIGYMIKNIYIILFN
jgi:hypothetical protein